MTPAASLPGGYALQLVELVARWQVTPEALLAGHDLTAAALADPATRVPLATYQALVRRGHQLTGEDGLGFCMGMQMRLSSHGFLGFAAMTARTVRDALDLAEQFAGTRTPVIGLHWFVEGGAASLVLQERVPLGDLREFVVTALFVGLAQIGAVVTGVPLTGAAEVSFAEPACYARFAHLIPGPVRFGQPSNRLVFAAELLDLPLVMADPIAAQLARVQCERELAAVGDRDDVTAQVRAALGRDHAGAAVTVDDAARRLHVSARTLKRQLAAAGTTFSAVLDEQRRERALLLLDDRSLTLDAIAERLGYSDVANFTRAFKRWTGRTPATVRRKS